MARTEKIRSIQAPPLNLCFFPESRENQGMEPVTLPFDEFEAIRLADQLKMGHKEASDIMGISRPTFTRLLEKARNHMAAFLVEGRPLQISGGSIRFSSNVYCCRNCRRPFKWGEKGEPICPRCGKSDSLYAHASCGGSCVCCEEKDLS